MRQHPGSGLIGLHPLVFARIDSPWGCKAFTCLLHGSDACHIAEALRLSGVKALTSATC